MEESSSLPGGRATELAIAQAAACRCACQRIRGETADLRSPGPCRRRSWTIQMGATRRRVPVANGATYRAPEGCRARFEQHQWSKGTDRGPSRGPEAVGNMPAAPYRPPSPGPLRGSAPIRHPPAPPCRRAPRSRGGSGLSAARGNAAPDPLAGPRRECGQRIVALSGERRIWAQPRRARAGSARAGQAGIAPGPASASTTGPAQRLRAAQLIARERAEEVHVHMVRRTDPPGAGSVSARARMPVSGPARRAPRAGSGRAGNTRLGGRSRALLRRGLADPLTGSRPRQRSEFSGPPDRAGPILARTGAGCWLPRTLARAGAGGAGGDRKRAGTRPWNPATESPAGGVDTARRGRR